MPSYPVLLRPAFAGHRLSYSRQAFPKILFGNKSVEYNLFKGPVHLHKLPTSLEYLTLSRDAITEVLVEDSLPNLSVLNLTQNRMGSRINPTFCKLPRLTLLDLSAGCCTTEAEKIALEKAAKDILCNKKVAVRAEGRFID